MSHSILGNMFYNRSDRPAWHGLGYNMGKNSEYSAVEALELVGGNFQVWKEPLYIEYGGERFRTDYFAIVREPIPQDNRLRVLGTPVSADYEIITPQKAAQLWDENVSDNGRPVPIETMGILNRGGRMFISTRLPSIDVRGDEITMHLLYDNPLESGRSLGVYTTATRVVCQNTLNAGIEGAVERRMISHSAGAIEAIGEWLQTIYARALMVRNLYREAFMHLSAKPVTDLQVRWIAENVYPLPPRPNAEHPMARRDYDERLGAYEIKVDMVMKARELVLAFYQGGGTGMNHESTNGTAFGAYNAVAELETYRRSQARAALDVINGDRGDRIRTAYNLCMSLN